VLDPLATADSGRYLSAFKQSRSRAANASTSYATRHLRFAKYGWGAKRRRPRPLVLATTTWKRQPHHCRALKASNWGHELFLQMLEAKLKIRKSFSAAAKMPSRLQIFTALITLSLLAANEQTPQVLHPGVLRHCLTELRAGLFQRKKQTMNSCAEGNDNDWNCSGFRGVPPMQFNPRQQVRLRGNDGGVGGLAVQDEGGLASS